MRGTQFAELSAFVAVAEHKSFTRAAQELGISTGTLSQSIRSLEERLGVRLLNRTTRSVSLSAVGERLLSRLRPVLDDYTAALESVNAFRDRPCGMLRLTVLPPAAEFLIAPMLAFSCGVSGYSCRDPGRGRAHRYRQRAFRRRHPGGGARRTRHGRTACQRRYSCSGSRLTGLSGEGGQA